MKTEKMHAWNSYTAWFQSNLGMGFYKLSLVSSYLGQTSHRLWYSVYTLWCLTGKHNNINLSLITENANQKANIKP